MARYFPVLFDHLMEPMDSWFENGSHLDRWAEQTAGLSARMDFYRKDGKLFVEAELPGIKPEDVDLHVYADRMTLAATKTAEKTEGGSGKNYLRAERSWGKVERMVSFPVEADPDTAKASFKNGVLTIEISEKSQDKAHKKVAISAED